ncbi:MAG: glycosyltransferase family 4 protein [Nitrososphaeraceae archaeon]|nr:glycosyltransferase family 4 protein [Nitrososphaeraceae archaeon]
MKIAFYSILNLGFGAGFEKWVEQVATALSSRGHQIIILTTKYGDNNNKFIQKNLCRHGVRVFEFKNYQRLFVIPTISAIRKIAKEIEDIDVLYFNNAFPLNELIVYLLKRSNNQNIKIISGYHGLYPETGNMIRRLYYRLVNKSVSKKFDAFHVLNLEDQNMLQSWRYRNVYKFPNGVDTGRYIPGQKKDIFTVMFAGRMVYQKGVDIFAKVVKDINDSQEKNMNFYIFGAGPLAYIVKDLEKKFTNVIYLSYVDEEKLIEAFQSAHVFVSPSRFETFLLTSLEAQSAGTPVIASNISGPKETVIRGQTGLLVNINPDEIADAILYFKDLWDKKNQEYSRYCLNARRNALSYDWKITVDKFEQMLSSVVKK